MFSKYKQYTTRDGRQVQLFTTDSGDVYFPIVGTVKEKDGPWRNYSWTGEGRYLAPPSRDHHNDLMEAPVVTRTFIQRSGSSHITTTGRGVMPNLELTWSGNDLINVKLLPIGTNGC